MPINCLFINLTRILMKIPTLPKFIPLNPSAHSFDNLFVFDDYFCRERKISNGYVVTRGHADGDCDVVDAYHVVQDLSHAHDLFRMEQTIIRLFVEYKYSEK